MPSVEQQEMILSATKVVVVAYIITSLLFDTMCMFRTPPSIHVTILVFIACAALLFVDGVLAALVLIGYICMNIQCLSKDYFRKKVETKIENYQNLIQTILAEDLVTTEEIIPADNRNPSNASMEIPSVSPEDEVMPSMPPTSSAEKIPLSLTLPPFLEQTVHQGMRPVDQEIVMNDYDDRKLELDDVFAKVDFYVKGPEKVLEDLAKDSKVLQNIIANQVNTDQLEKIQSNIYDEENLRTFYQETDNKNHFNIQGIPPPA